MTPSNAIHTPIEAPSIAFGNPPLRICATHSGDRVTGWVEFPHEVCGATHCPIDYRRSDPTSSGSLRPGACPDAVGIPSSLPQRAAARLDLVTHWHRLCNENPTTAKGILAQRVVAQATAAGVTHVSVRSLQNWSHTLDIEGPNGLRDRYVRPPQKVLGIDARHATYAVQVCAWWAYRIGSATVIDTTMMSIAAALIDGGYAVADILATIDCYYAYPTDRAAFPFKPFARWVKHDFEKWLLRACESADYVRGLQAAKPVAPPRTRQRDVTARTNRRALRTLAGDSPSPCPSIPEPVPTPSGSLPPSVPCTLYSVGLDGLARDMVARRAPGIPALKGLAHPASIGEFLGALDDGYRRMFLAAGRRDRDARDARDEALATMPLWWDRVPDSVRHDIDFRLAAWRSDHPHVTETAVASRRLDMFLPNFRDRRLGLERLGVARRLPA